MTKNLILGPILVQFAYCFLRDIHEGHLSLKDADDEQSNFAAQIKNLGKDKKNKTKLKNSSLKITLDYHLVQEKMFLITLKAYNFQ